MKYRVEFSREGKALEIEEGVTLLEAQRRAGLAPDAPCSGQGTCGKCTVILEDARGRRRVRACQTRVNGPATVDTSPSANNHAILTGGAGRAVEFDPVFRRGTVKLPRTRESLSQWHRLQRGLEEAFGESFAQLPPDLALASELYAMSRQSDTWQVILGPAGVLSMTLEPVPCYAAALDVGTTTLVGYLINMDTGETAATCSRMNPQAQYGADVLLRANYAMKEGSGPLTGCIREAVGDILASLSREAGISQEDIFGVSLVGNTCMHHLLLGLSPASLVHAPYNPAVGGLLTLPASRLGLPIHPKGLAIVLPNIAGFVGADTLGCLLATRPDLDEGVSLLIDIGTNGELVLAGPQGLMACSTAAGPAFEGAKIQCGMRGADGAVDHVSSTGGSFSYTTIGHAPARGLCGSGLIDLTACLLREGLLGPTGILSTEKFSLTPSVYLSQKDVRELQLAKAAIAAGIRTLLQLAGLSLNQVDRVYMAGAFGSYMDAASACRIGLIPQGLETKIIPIGNAAGEGAKIALLSRRELETSRLLAEKTRFLELASSPDFQDYFVEELEFPRETP